MEHDKGPEIHSRRAGRRLEVQRWSPREASCRRVLRRRQDATPEGVMSAPASAPRAPAHGPENDLPSRAASIAETSVLVVDADRRTRKVLVDSFATFGLQCVEACDAEQALELIERRCPGLGVLSIHLPGMSGGELAWRIRQLNLEFPLVGLLDGRTLSVWDKDDLHHLGFNALFTKPVEHEDFISYCEGMRSQATTQGAAERHGRPV